MYVVRGLIIAEDSAVLLPRVILKPDDWADLDRITEHRRPWHFLASPQSCGIFMHSLFIAPLLISEWHVMVSGLNIVIDGENVVDRHL